MTTASLRKAFGSIGDNWMMKAIRRLFAAQRSSFLFGSATYDPASLTTGSGATTTITVTGAALGDFVMPSNSLDLQGILLTAYVSAANTVSVRFQNQTGGTLDLLSATVAVLVLKGSNFSAKYLMGLEAN